MKAPLPRETARLKALHECKILDTPSEKVFDDITQLAASVCQTPIAWISFIDRDRQWFKSCVGWEATEISRDLAFCAQTILQPEVLLVSNVAADDRFTNNPLVTAAPHLQFYAGVPLIVSGDRALGTLSVCDLIARELEPQQLAALQGLAAQVVQLLELRRHQARLEDTELKRQANNRQRQRFFSTITAGFGLATLILAGLGWVSYRSLNDLVQATHSKAKHRQVLDEINNIQLALQAADNAKNSYIQTGQESYLRQYEDRAAVIAQEINELQQVSADNPAQLQQIVALESMINSKLAEIKPIVNQRQQAGAVAASQLLSTPQTKQLTAEITTTLRQLQTTETALLSQATQATTTRTRNSFLTFASGIFLNFLLLIFVYYYVRREISARQHVEIALEQERDFTITILDTVASLVVVIDSHGRIVRFNRSCEQISGYSLDEIKGKYFWELFLISAEVDKVKAAMEELLSNQFSNQFETYWVTRDGSHRLITWSNTTLRDQTGAVEYAIATGVDITQQQSATAALRHSEQYLRDILNSIFTFVAVLSPAGILLEANRAIFAAAAVPLEDAIAKPFVDAYWWSYSPTVQAQLQAAIQRVSQGEKTRMEVHSRIGAEQFIILDFALTPMFDSAGQVNYLIASAIDITERKQAEAARQQANEQLSGWVNELEQRNREITLLTDLSDILQACLTFKDAYTAIATMVQPLFPNTSGGLYLISSSKNLVEAVTTWGSPPEPSSSLFTPHECWALRRGRTHLVNSNQVGLLCPHLQQPLLAAESLCVPMMAQGEAIGILLLCAPELGQLTAAKKQLAITVAEHIALALANLKLRETLQDQSIRDPITGLFNRRYMEESLDREIQRCERKRQALSIIMLDVDHFKRFNDTFGHEAGDIVLRELGQFLQRYVRGSDIACRYGGEEFTLILPEASLEVCRKRAEQLRQGVRHLNLQHRHHPLGAITLSIGVACFPEHGLSSEVVIRAADTALYRAKQQGRDRVVTAV